MYHPPFPRLLAATALLSIAVGLTACSDYSAPGGLGSDQEILGSCPKDLKLNTYVQVDGTGSNRSEQITSERLSVIEKLARETAVCGGHLTVVGYSAGSASTVTIYDGELSLPGATDIARLRKVPEAVEQIATEIGARYNTALDSLPDGGSDIAGMWRLAAEQQTQLGDGYQLRYVNLTDGLDNLSGALSGTLSVAEAEQTAATVAVPDLSGARVTIAGVGRVSGPPVPSPQVEALIAFYSAMCKNSDAADCIVVTDWR
jgi:hypothetical protein